VVFEANTATDPWTMVIHAHYALAAGLAVVRPRWLRLLAAFAIAVYDQILEVWIRIIFSILSLESIVNQSAALNDDGVFAGDQRSIQSIVHLIDAQFWLSVFLFALLDLVELNPSPVIPRRWIGCLSLLCLDS